MLLFVWKLIILNFGFSRKMTCGFTQQETKKKTERINFSKLNNVYFFIIVAQVSPEITLSVP